MVLKYQSTHALKIILILKKGEKAFQQKISVAAKYEDVHETSSCFLWNFFWLELEYSTSLFGLSQEKHKTINVSNVVVIVIGII